MTVSAIVVDARAGASIAARVRAVQASAVIICGRASPIAIERIRAALDAPPASVVAPRPRVASIIARVAAEMGLRVSDIVGASPSSFYSRSRSAVSYLARLHGRTAAETGRAMGDRDHSTILYQLRRADDLIARDPAFRMVTNRVSNAIALGELA